jgi:hypothetical protein
MTWPCLMNFQTKLSKFLVVSNKASNFQHPTAQLLQTHKLDPNFCQIYSEYKNSTSLRMLANQPIKHCSLLPKQQHVSLGKLFTKYNIKYWFTFSQLLHMPDESQNSDITAVFCKQHTKCTSSFKC